MSREDLKAAIERRLAQASREELGNVYQFVMHLCKGEEERA